MRVQDLPTPALLVDVGALDRNIATMAQRWPGARLRPSGAKPGLVRAAMDVLARAHADVGGDVISGGGTGTWDVNGWITELQAGSCRTTVRVGDRVRVIPAQVDPTVSQHERLHVVSGEEVVDVWDVDLSGW